MFRFVMSWLGRDRARPRPGAIPRPPPGEPPPRSRVIDVEGMIRQASTRVSVDRLLQSGKKYIHLLSREKVDELINRSVRTIIDKHRAAAAHRDAVSAAQMEAESRAEFEALLEQFEQTAEARRAVEQSRETLGEELKVARFEVVPGRPREEDRPFGNGRTEPLGRFEEVARALESLVGQASEHRSILLGRSGSTEAALELVRVDGRLHSILSPLLPVERERPSGPPGDAHEIAFLQKRIEKLNAHIATMEAALKTLSTARTFSNQQVQNLLRDLGLAPEDRHFEKKKEMLKVVLSANQGIRRKARELAARGITLEAPEEKADFSQDSDSLSGVLSRSSA